MAKIYFLLACVVLACLAPRFVQCSAEQDVLGNILQMVPNLRGQPYYTHKVVEVFGQSIFDPLGVPVYGTHDPSKPIGSRVLVTEKYYVDRSGREGIYRFLYLGSHCESVISCRIPDDFVRPDSSDGDHTPLSKCEVLSLRPEVEYGYAMGTTFPALLSVNQRRRNPSCTNPADDDILCTKQTGEAVHVLWGGLGGGASITYMQALLGDRIKHTVVELDPEVAEAAKEAFGFNLNGDVDVVNGDFMEYVQNTEHQFDAIMLDISGDSDGDDIVVEFFGVYIDKLRSIDIHQRMMPSPTLSSEEFLRTVKDKLKPHGFALQHAWTVPQFVENSNRVMNILYDIFPAMYWARTRESTSMLMFAFKEDFSVSLEEMTESTKRIMEVTNVDEKEDINLMEMQTIWQGNLKASLDEYRNYQTHAEESEEAAEGVGEGSQHDEL